MRTGRFLEKKVLEKIKEKLVRAYNPVAIYLFGSHAWGVPTKDSDLDLLIVVEKSELNHELRPIAAYDALEDVHVPLDIIVYTRNEFEHKIKDVSTLGYKIKQEGRVVYGAI